MQDNVRKFIQNFGLYVIIASLCSGCATETRRMPMTAHDLNYFRIDCSRKEEQIRMLVSMQQSGDEQLAALWTNSATFWTKWTEPDQYDLRRDISSGNINRQITYNLQLLRNCR